MPTSTIAAGTKEHTFVASVFSFIEGNWTLFFTYDGCQEGNAQTFFSDSCYANFQEFRKNLREISKKTIPIGKQSCTPQLFAPPHRSHTAIKEVPVVGFTVKIQIDFQGQTFSVEVCEDQNWGSCTPFWTKEQVRFVESPKYGALDLIFHNGWNTPARVGNKFSIDQYTNVTEVCKLYRP
ncbi:uncharacterized protein LOC111255431 [Varroa destructor]|uniref:Uncharacterized protein n=2 Tax=Varroa TaxID=62624 RepID=A0A7M7KWN9_VARDE|nr:uncharacterized protein LOC111255431 [Varroa destructor]